MPTYLEYERQADEIDKVLAKRGMFAKPKKDDEVIDDYILSKRRQAHKRANPLK